MKISTKGLTLVKKFEGLYLEAYKDPVGVWTIGWGNTGPEAFRGNRISRTRAEELLKADMREFEGAVKSAVEVPLNCNQFDALVSFAFNCGEYALKKSTLLRLLNQSNYAAAANEFHRWNKGTINGAKTVLRGLTRRRAAEANLFLTPVVPRANLSDSRTMTAGKVAVAATTCGALAETVRMIEPVSPIVLKLVGTAPWIVFGLVALGIAWMMFARWDDHRRGVR